MGGVEKGVIGKIFFSLASLYRTAYVRKKKAGPVDPSSRAEDTRQGQLDLCAWGGAVDLYRDQPGHLV